MKNKQLILTAVVALILGALGGYYYAQAQAPAPRTAGAPGSGARGNFTRGGTNGAGFITGTVAKEDSSSITIDTRDGSSRVILVTPTTTVQKSVSGSMSDVATGSTVLIQGTTNSDGSLSATSIQLRPASPTGTVGQ